MIINLQKNVQCIFIEEGKTWQLHYVIDQNRKQNILDLEEEISLDYTRQRENCIL